LLTVLLIAPIETVKAEPAPAYGAELQGFDYGFPVQTYSFKSQRAALSMRYIDVKPEHGNGRTVVLLHGKNFCAGTWAATIDVLSKRGYPAPLTG
jgi:pimeloyl-ACP methyl ester carboxylesterase